jgi:hypothetical protein
MKCLIKQIVVVVLSTTEGTKTSASETSSKYNAGWLVQVTWGYVVSSRYNYDVLL